jgi:haloalkane dehalogenase
MTSLVDWQKSYVNVLGSRMAFVERGSGDPIVFLHGNPTSSYLWRNIVPHVRDLGRGIAPDLIGMGDSGKLPAGEPDRYSLVGHQKYLDALLDTLGCRDHVTLVVHDWGSALGFDWARRHPEAVHGIAYMEAIVRPMSMEEWPPRKAFEAMRSAAGEEMVLANNFFVEKILPRSIIRSLSEEEMNEYRRPFASPGEDRRLTLTWPREMPLDGEPPQVVAVVDAYSSWLAGSPVPKLFINAEPGAILVGAMREYCRSWPAQREVTVKGIHFIQEDSPNEIGAALRAWLLELVAAQAQLVRASSLTGTGVVPRQPCAIASRSSVRRSSASPLWKNNVDWIAPIAACTARRTSASARSGRSGASRCTHSSV